MTQAAASTSKSTSELWTSIARAVDLRSKLSQWVILADFVSVQVPGSVEEERLFSKLAFIKNDRRNRLEEEHLNVCLTLATQRMWEFEQFPFERAIAKWSAAKQRRPAPVGTQQQQQPVLVLDSDDDELV